MQARLELIAFKCFIDCIETGEYMHVYNSIMILQELLPVFPMASVNEFAGPALAAALDRFLEKEDRADLKVIGQAFASHFNKRKPIWSAPERAVKVNFESSLASHMILIIPSSHYLLRPLRRLLLVRL